MGACGDLLLLWPSKTSFICPFPCSLNLLPINLEYSAFLWCLPAVQILGQFQIIPTKKFLRLPMNGFFEAWNQVQKHLHAWEYGWLWISLYLHGFCSSQRTLTALVAHPVNASALLRLLTSLRLSNISYSNMLAIPEGVYRLYYSKCCLWFLPFTSLHLNCSHSTHTENDSFGLNVIELLTRIGQSWLSLLLFLWLLWIPHSSNFPSWVIFLRLAS